MVNSGFVLRMMSALVLGPLTLLAIYAGDLYFQIFVAIAFGISIKEWVGMAKKGQHFIRDGVLGAVYITLCFIAFMKLRMDLDQGLFLTICLLLGVWASDIGAYFSGKLIGGPKLAEKISPNKTWAGFVGGTAASAVMLGALNYYASAIGSAVGLEFLSFAPIMMAFIIGALFTVVGQAGDLLISWYKRKVDVKDTGTLIPGHGGILDRIDSLLLVGLFFLIVLSEILS